MDRVRTYESTIRVVCFYGCIVVLAARDVADIVCISSMAYVVVEVNCVNCLTLLAKKNIEPPFPVLSGD